MTIEHILFAYVAVTLGGLALVCLYYEFRRRSFGPTQSEDHVFRCDNCSYVYTDDPDVDRSRCPQCGQVNEAFEF